MEHLRFFTAIQNISKYSWEEDLKSDENEVENLERNLKVKLIYLFIESK